MDPSRLIKALCRPVHRVLTVNDILPRLADGRFITFRDTNFGYHDLKCHKNHLSENFFRAVWQAQICKMTALGHTYS